MTYAVPGPCYNRCTRSFESARMAVPDEPKFNTYQTQVDNVAAMVPRTYIPGGRTVAAGQGLEWLIAAWRLFIEAPMMWIVMIVLYAVFYLILAVAPVVGSLVGYIVYGVIAAGWLAGAHAVASGEKLELNHMFAGFRNKTASLLIVGVVYAAGLLVILLLMGASLAIGLGASGAISAILSGDSSQLATIAATSIMSFMVALLVGAALLAPLMAALWFAPALVYFHNEPPLTALKVSFFACLKNWLPFLVYGVLLLILLLIAAIPLGLGLLVAGPMTLISGYTSYRDLFTDPA